MRVSTPIGAWERAQLRAFVEIDVALKWPIRHTLPTLRKELEAYLYTHLCHTLGQNEADNLYDGGWEPVVDVDGDCFVVELVQEERDETQ